MESSAELHDIDSEDTFIASTGAQTRSSFFGRLNYDIRALIYEQIWALPPMVFFCDCTGFILSCRLAKEEMECISRNRVNKFLAQFKDSIDADLSCRVAVPFFTEGSTFEELQAITILVQFPIGQTHEPMPLAKFWSALYPILHASFTGIFADSKVREQS
jgi:hypothetical protein